jgi:hypothetical protein
MTKPDGWRRCPGCADPPLPALALGVIRPMRDQRPTAEGSCSGKTGRVSGTSKYAKLAALLAASGANVVELTFAEVASVVPDGLPESAYRYRTWWTSNTDASAQSRHGWTRAGYRVSQVDLTNRVVTFVQHSCRPAAGNRPEAIPTGVKPRSTQPDTQRRAPIDGHGGSNHLGDTRQLSGPNRPGLPVVAYGRPGR